MSLVLNIYDFLVQSAAKLRFISVLVLAPVAIWCRPPYSGFVSLLLSTGVWAARKWPPLHQILKAMMTKEEVAQVIAELILSIMSL